MNGADNSARVPKPPGGLEKAGPRAKRIVPGMVAETALFALMSRAELAEREHRCDGFRQCNQDSQHKL
jgi:hypothetical protein